jgi:PAS domain S-box-containing protein
VIEAALDAVISIDATGRIVQFNAAAERMFGYAREAAIGEPLAELVIPPALQAAHWSGLLRIVAGEPPRILDRRVELTALRRDGTEFPVELTVTKTNDSPLLLTGFVRELSKLDDGGREVARQLAGAEELVAMGRWERDLQSNESRWSAELFRIYGLEPGDLAPSPETFLELVHPDDREKLKSIQARVAAGPQSFPENGLIAEYRVIRPDGQIREIRAHASVESNGDAPRWVGWAQDVTDQREIERALRVHDGVSQALHEWASFDESAESLLERMGTALGLPVGSLWVADEAEEDMLTCRAFWSASDFEIADFEDVSRESGVRRGQGAAGTAWDTARPVIREDIETDPKIGRRQAAADLGLRSAVAVPAVDDGRSVAVLAFYSLDRHSSGAPLVRTLTAIADELGRFMGRRRAELGPGRLTPRELEVLWLAAEGRRGPEIAAALVVSPATVKTHFENIYAKLGVRDRAGAVALALRAGIID